MNKQRIQWIDFLKGIGIILVIIGHAPRDIMRENYLIIDLLYKVIYSFHMGLFFAISGYVYGIYKNNNPSIFIKKIVKKLLIPWIIYSFIIYASVYILNIIPFTKKILLGTNLELISITEYIKQMIACNNQYSFHLWFIYILFIIQISYIIIEKIKYKTIKYFVLPLIFL